MYVWGKNFDGELGNGKKSSVSTPLRVQLEQDKEMTMGERLMLMKRKAKEVRDLKGKVWGKGVKVRQCLAAGYGTSAVYWKIE